MRQFGVEVKEQKELKKMVCNCCGKELMVKGGIVREGVFSAEYSWGYFSEKDGETHSFDLCEECYDKWIGGFKIPVEIQK
ncbi:hypothetical protein DXB23_06645 [Dorea sp. OM02-2LB]|jgi:competence CoiA-like predicted nuclease|nr:hypothetical protein DXB23_06645 [Dorea sp. OM02-2LB]